MADYGAGLQIIDLRAPGGATPVAFVEIWNAASVVVEGGYAYVGQNIGLSVVDVSNPTAPITVGSVSEGFTGNWTDIAIAGGYAYVAGSNGFMVIVDIGDPTIPTIASVTPISGVAVAGGIGVAGAYAYLAVDKAGGAGPARVQRQ